jgi:GATA-binding protein
MYGNHLPVFNGHLDDHYNHHIHHSPSLPHMHIQRQPTPGRSASPLNGQSHLGMTQTPEQLIAEISSLKTRVSELEVINDLFRSRVTQLETDESNSRHAAEMCRESEHNMSQQLEESRRREAPQLAIQLEESRRRENQLKHRLDDVERELNELKEGAPPAKKIRVADMVGDSEVSTPQSVA